MSDYDHPDPNYDPNLDPSYTQPMRLRDVGNYGQGSSVRDQLGMRDTPQHSGSLTALVDRINAIGQEVARIDQRLLGVYQLLSGGAGSKEAPGVRGDVYKGNGILPIAHEKLDLVAGVLNDIDTKISTIQGILGD